MSDFDHLTERQQIALGWEALVEGERIHEVRRRALRVYADAILSDPTVRDQVRNVLRYRRENGVHRPFTRLRSVGAS